MIPRSTEQQALELQQLSLADAWGETNKTTVDKINREIVSLQDNGGPEITSHIRELFAQIDTDNSGCLSREEVVQLLEGCEMVDATLESRREYRESYDLDGSGAIDLEEFALIYTVVMRQQQQQKRVRRLQNHQQLDDAAGENGYRHKAASAGMNRGLFGRLKATNSKRKRALPPLETLATATRQNPANATVDVGASAQRRDIPFVNADDKRQFEAESQPSQGDLL